MTHAESAHSPTSFLQANMNSGSKYWTTPSITSMSAPICPTPSSDSHATILLFIENAAAHAHARHEAYPPQFIRIDARMGHIASSGSH